MKSIEILNNLENKNTTFSFCMGKRINIPFDVTAQDFLQFAENDLASKYHHNIINALSNAKRALDCQIEVLLMGFGFRKFSDKKHWSFPQKIDLIKRLGVIAPRVLGKINATRNLMEHQFIKPEKEKVEDFLDITSLFLASTDKFVFSLPYEAGFKCEKAGIVFRLDYENSILKIKTHKLKGIALDFDKIEQEDVIEESELSPEEENYIKVLALYLAKTRKYS